MSTTDHQQGTPIIGIRAIYEQTEYPVDILGVHFLFIDRVWDASLKIATERLIATGQPIPDEERSEIEQMIDTLLSRQPGIYGAERSTLEVLRLRLESPMEVTLAVVQGGRCPRRDGVRRSPSSSGDPARVGGWLPGLIGSWHTGMAHAERARYERDRERIRRKHRPDPVEEARQVLIDSNHPLRAVDVETAGDAPDDLFLAVTADLRDEGPTDPTDTAGGSEPGC